MADFKDVLTQLKQVVQPGDGILAAVSGGADSMALCDVLLRDAPTLGVWVAVGHVHHHLRAASDAEWQFVEAFCAARGVDFYGRHVDVLAACAESGENVEAAAHRLRHAALQEMADACGAQWIALAHHANDRAETVLMHMMRGSGGSGLAAMPAVRGRLLRPLLGHTRTEIEAYLRARGLAWVNDESNEDTRYLRNRVRHEILPMLESVNPKVVMALNRLAENSLQEQDFIRQSAAALFDKAVDFEAAHWCLLQRPPLLDAHAAVRGAMLRQQCEKYLQGRSPLHQEMLRQVDALLEAGGGRYDLGGGLIFECTRRWVYIGCQPQGEWAYRDGQWQHDFLESRLDAAADFYVRGFEGKDWLRVKNLGRKRVKKIFQEAGLPPCLRAHWPMVCDIKTKEVIWLPFLAQTSQVMYYNSINYVRVQLVLHIARRQTRLDITMKDKQ